MNLRNEGEDIERRMRELGEELGRLTPTEVDVDAIEAKVRDLANAWGRAQMARAMKRADSQGPEVEINGDRWGNRRSHGHDYETVFGTVSIERGVYQQSGRGRVAVPMDLRLGMVEGPRMAPRALASMPEHEAADLLGEVGSAALSNSTIGRLSRSMAARYERLRGLITAVVRETHVIPEQAVTVQEIGRASCRERVE